ncbi:uncharacterized protein LOC116019046 [Ipomoea triloba]|uniref:uncharacterized protein LOC116019046 n=1 Tax=Ipomoea triloba TaxID=35885 RepID=UPI00125CF82D|nr:uncharacterized protein LOC116019046 [Ipomoea triloba]XP_031114975.1 uncharacterized protein LOC116019046 [Ipomoea triloba]XP_031114977.1 uncharacterized protein LOC116019046 [Ipomoea triloba]
MRWRFSRLGSQYLIRRRSQQLLRAGNPTPHFHTLKPSHSKSNLSRTHFPIASNYTTSAPETKPISSEAVLGIVDEISGLTLLEVSDLTETLRKKMGVEEMPVMTMMMPGMGFSPGGLKGKGGAAKAEEKAEKTVFDLKLEGGFDSGAKIKIIKEVRSFTDLGLKEAKELVEKAPAVLKKGVTKEEAEKIIEKMKGVGAIITME